MKRAFHISNKEYRKIAQKAASIVLRIEETNRDIVLAAVRHHKRFTTAAGRGDDELSHLCKISPKLKNDREVVLKCVKNDP